MHISIMGFYFGAVRSISGLLLLYRIGAFSAGNFSETAGGYPQGLRERRPKKEVGKQALRRRAKKRAPLALAGCLPPFPQKIADKNVQEFFYGWLLGERISRQHR